MATALDNTLSKSCGFSCSDFELIFASGFEGMGWKFERVDLEFLFKKIILCTVSSSRADLNLVTAWPAVEKVCPEGIKVAWTGKNFLASFEI